MGRSAEGSAPKARNSEQPGLTGRRDSHYALTQKRVDQIFARLRAKRAAHTLGKKLSQGSKHS